MKKIVDGRLDYDEMVKDSYAIATRMAKLFNIEPPKPLVNKNKIAAKKYNFSRDGYDRKNEIWKTEKLMNSYFLKHPKSKRNKKSLDDNKKNDLSLDSSKVIKKKEYELFKKQLEKERPQLHARKAIPKIDSFDDGTENSDKAPLVGLHWTLTKSINPFKDKYKVQKALKIAIEKNINPFKIKDPEELICKYDNSPIQKRLNNKDLPDSTKKVIGNTNISTMKKDRDVYNAAKYNGDDEAGKKIIDQVVKKSKVDELKQSLDPNKKTYIIPITNYESDKKMNVLPFALASHLKDEIPNSELHLKTEKISDTALTGATRRERVQSEHIYVGDLPEDYKDAQFVIADDTFTSGSTMRPLIDSLIDKGCDVKSPFVLATSRDGGFLKQSESRKQELLDKIDYDGAEEIINGLTANETKHLAKTIKSKKEPIGEKQIKMIMSLAGYGSSPDRYKKSKAKLFKKIGKDKAKKVQAKLTKIDKDYYDNLDDNKGMQKILKELLGADKKHKTIEYSNNDNFIVPPSERFFNERSKKTK